MPRIGSDAFQKWLQTNLKISGLFRFIICYMKVFDYNKFKVCDFESER